MESEEIPKRIKTKIVSNFKIKARTQELNLLENWLFVYITLRYIGLYKINNFPGIKVSIKLNGFEIE